MRAFTLAVLLVVAGLAGCLGGEDADGGEAGPTAPSTPGGGGDGEPGTEPGQSLTDLRFEIDDPVSEIVWENGTFQITDHSHPLVNQAVHDASPDRREIDLTPLVPQGVPVVLTAEVDAEMGEGDVDIFFEIPSGEIWSGETDTPYGGYSLIEATVLHTSSDPITLVLRYDEVDDSASFDYTLRYSVSYEPGLVPDGVPVGVPVPEEATGLRVEFGDEREGRSVLVWDPQDTFLGRFDPGDERVTLPLDGEAPRGEHVVLLAAGSGPAHISLAGTEQDPGPLRALLQEIVFGQPHQAASGESEITWSFQTDRAPLQAGIFWDSSEVSQNTRGSLASPTTELFSMEIQDDPWIGGLGFGMLTEVGAPGLVAGSYEASVAFDENAGPSPMEATHALVFYDRGR